MAMKSDIICGLAAVAAVFARRPADVHRLFYVDEMGAAAGPFCARLAADKRPYRLLPKEEMAKAAGTSHHGGICAVTRLRRVEPLDISAPPRVPLLLALDGVSNPHNLGAIARSAAFFGVEAMLLHEVAGAAMPSSAAYRTAKGGLEHVQLYRTHALDAALRALAPFYCTAAATLGPDSVGLRALPRDRAVALVLGHEEYGVSAKVAVACDHRVRIAGTGQVQSLNVAQAAVLLIHALSGCD
jgi:RNA methyltransferase, TrmH family